ncbi:MAG TPA: polysaccharide pyruvyl transferase family protein [Dehalococcoidia bacterium]|nr:polysaccharide pyruvyl transferase family protein [Dehalococcoidia bacterium]
MNPSRKIGVLTFHRCINYGSYWQTCCLVAGLRARGHDAVIINHNSGRVNAAEWKCALQPVLPTPVARRDRLLYGVKLLKFIGAFSALPRSPRLPLEDPDRMESYDVVIVGSDEVWNLTHPWYGGTALFFGDGVRTRRLVAYAASFGNYDPSTGLEPAWADRLRGFQGLSVRDENSRTIIRGALGFDPELVLDPCLQFAPRAEGRRRDAGRRFVAVYGHNFSPWFVREARRWAARCGYPLVSIGYRNDWADAQWITAGPRDFPRFIARAEAVVTNFFHGCVFALRQARPFICETSPYRAIKVQNLLRTVGGEPHLVSAATPSVAYDTRLEEPPAPAIFQQIEHLRRTSEAYLDKALA